MDSQAAELAALRLQLATETERADQPTARGERDRATAQSSIARLESQLGERATRVSDLERQLDTTCGELDTAHSGQARLEAQLAAATQRADDAATRTERADTARAEAERERAAIERPATRLEAQLEQARACIDELSVDRDRLTTALTQAQVVPRVPGPRRANPAGGRPGPATAQAHPVDATVRQLSSYRR